MSGLIWKLFVLAVLAGAVGCAANVRSVTGPAVTPCPDTVRPTPQPELARLEPNRSSTYRIDNGKGGHGTGVALSREGHILTVAHVVADADRITVNVPLGKNLSEVHEARILAVQPKDDLAVIKIDRPLEDTVILADDDEVVPGDSVYSDGYPLMFGPLLSRGYVARRDAEVRLTKSVSEGLSEEFLIRDCVIADINVAPGSSGAGLYSQRTGRLVGNLSVSLTVTHTAGEPPMYLHLFVATRIIREFLDKHGIPYLTAGGVPDTDGTE
ncbi:hypothetical protein AMJ57_03980 [Parcubacteria bacterium SG8_24]|nr:MAG: hypothetical protein AMJ57_03980 [Parcubacteria bacterium SG8_24]